MAAKRKKRKLDGVKQTHAKVEEKFQPTTLDQIWGDDGSSEYGTLSYEKYKDKVYDMNMSDLQAHASRVGIVPVDNRNMLTDRLLREFGKHALAYSKPAETSAAEQKIPEEVKQILAEGR